MDDTRDSISSQLEMSLSKETQRMLAVVLTQIQNELKPKSFGDMCAIIIEHIQARWHDNSYQDNAALLEYHLIRHQELNKQLVLVNKCIQAHIQRHYPRLFSVFFSMGSEMQRQPIIRNWRQQLQPRQSHQPIHHIERQFTYPEQYTSRMNSRGLTLSYPERKPPTTDPLEPMRIRGEQTSTEQDGFIPQTSANISHIKDRKGNK